MVGNSVPGGVFFKDVKPGSYVVATATEVERRLSFTLAAGQNRYVKTSVSIGILVGRVIPELVDPEVGRSAIQGAVLYRRYDGRQRVVIRKLRRRRFWFLRFAPHKKPTPALVL